MKVLFAHDHVFKVDSENHVFSPGKLPYKVLQRYLHYFDELVVIGRCQPITNNSRNLSLSSGNNITFSFLPNLATPKGLIIDRNKLKSNLCGLLSTVDAIIVRLPSENGSLIAELAQKMNKPWAAEVVACPWDSLWNYGGVQGKIYAPIMFLRTRKLISKSPFVIYVTNRFLQNRLPNTGYNCGISDVEIPPPTEDVLTKRLYKINRTSDRSVFTFGLIGSLTSRYKGVQTAFSALSKIRNDIPPFELKILGDGNNLHFKKLAEKLNLTENVIFNGTLPGGEPVREWLDCIDIYLQPSLQEGLPRTVVEALSRACPTIGSTAGGIPELLEPEFLHSPGNSNQLSHLIKKLTLNKELQVSSAIKNFNKSIEFSNDILNEKRNVFWETFSNSVKTNKNSKYFT